MVKKSPPHLVFRKQPTIVSEDPFKTDKEEAALGKIFAKRIQEIINKAEPKLKKEFAGREMGGELLDPSITAFGTDDLYVDAYEYSKKGYMKGIVLSNQQLAPLGISINVNMNTPVVKKTLAYMDKNSAKLIDEYGDWLSAGINDIVKEGLKNGKTFDDIMTEIQIFGDKSINRANQIATRIIIDAARKSEFDTLTTAGIEIFRWITVTDSKTCETCLAMNGQIYTWDPVADSYYNMDTNDLMRDELADLAAEFGVEDWIEADANGPPIHHAGECRCHFQPVMTYEQFKQSKESDAVKTIVSEI